MRITGHFRKRLTGCLSTIISDQEIIRACEGLNPRVGETWVLVKRLDKEVVISDCGRIINGDALWVIIKKATRVCEPALVTIILRRWGQGVKSGRHFYESPSVDKGVCDG